jgi:hypothetical protein
MILEKLPNHYCPHMEEHLDGYIIKDIFNEKLFNTLHSHAVEMYEKQSTKNFGKHNTILHFEGKKLKLLQNAPANREIYLIYDIPTTEKYYYQTNETVRDYVFDYIRNNTHPAYVSATNVASKLDVFDDDCNKYVPLRCHFNWITYERFLAMHIDGHMNIWKTYSNKEARLYSFTIYLNEISYGGQFFTSTGFVYDPKPNTAIAINGTKIYHGINENKDIDKRPRLAFTIRFAHIDDLYLPGSPDKMLYKLQDFFTDT